MFRPRRILHPTDFSLFSDYALRIAADLARQNQAILLIVHTVPTLGPEGATYGEAVSQLEPEGYRQRVAQDLRQSVPAPQGVQCEYILAQGDPAREICRVARDQACDLIVMGTHGRTGISHLMMGSIAEQVIRRAPCPVLTAKLPAQSPQPVV
jgi:nucleotide-binding universal stress UspA family protein